MNIIYLLEDVGGKIQVGEEGLIFTQNHSKYICYYVSPYFGRVLKAYFDGFDEFCDIVEEKELEHTNEKGKNIILILELIRGDIDIKEDTIAFFHNGEYCKTSIDNPHLGMVFRAYLEGFSAFAKIKKNSIFMLDSY